MKKILIVFVFTCMIAFAQETPELFAPDVISGADEEFRITFTPDGKTAYFARSPAGAWFPFSRQATIYETKLEGDTWTTPQVASFSGKYSDIDPFISPDGTRLYFSSIRPVNSEERGDADLWMVEREGSTWGEAVHLGEAVNSPRDDLFPSVDEAGVLYFGSERDAESDGDGWNIYTATPDGTNAYSAAEKLPDTVNSLYWDFNPTIMKDGNTLYFVSLEREGGNGFGDIYISRLENNSWTQAELLGNTINTGFDEFHPSLSPDETILFFVRRGEDNGDLYSFTLPTAE